MNDHDEEIEKESAVLVEGRDFYLENGLMVMTRYFLLTRGYCCESGCRHCPYGFDGTPALE
jgi:Family of unknown function (DUF5522)